MALPFVRVLEHVQRIDLAGFGKRFTLFARARELKKGFVQTENWERYLLIARVLERTQI
jgi:hypothetical protein